jgi:hypothetical protein
MKARWHIKRSLDALNRTMKDPRSTSVDELNACLILTDFDFFCYCQEKILIREKKLRKLSEKLENLRILNHHF